jgi:hypothetical protein
MPAIGRAGHPDVAVGDHDVLGGALEQLGRDQPRLAHDLARRARHGGPGHRGDAAGDRAHAEADAIGVAAAHAHALDRHAELGGGDLGQRRLVRLALRADADVDEARRRWIDADVRALERARCPCPPRRRESRGRAARVPRALACALRQAG